MRSALFISCLCCSAQLQGAIAFVTQTVGSKAFSGTTLTITIPTPSSGALLVACIGLNDQTVTISGITGGGVTWVQALRAPYASAVTAAAIWYGPNSSGSGTSVVITTSAAIETTANISQYSDVATSSPLDVIGPTTSVGTSTSPVSGTATTANANDLLIGMFNDAPGNAPSAGPTNSFTGLTNATQGTNMVTASAYRIVSSTASYSTGWTITSADWAGAFASFKQSGSVAAPKRLLTLGVGD